MVFAALLSLTTVHVRFAQAAAGNGTFMLHQSGRYIPCLTRDSHGSRVHVTRMCMWVAVGQSSAPELRSLYSYLTSEVNKAFKHRFEGTTQQDYRKLPVVIGKRNWRTAPCSKLTSEQNADQGFSWSSDPQKHIVDDPPKYMRKAQVREIEQLRIREMQCKKEGRFCEDNMEIRQMSEWGNNSITPRAGNMWQPQRPPLSLRIG
eukprot:2029248-Amphidinium_carterae.1